MKVHKQVVQGIIPYIIIVDDGESVYVYNKGTGKSGLFRTKESAEERAISISNEHPSWKLTIKQANGIAY